MTDPEGVGWMDPNGFEIADKCEFGPQLGTPLGFAGPDHAPFNQVINGHQYLLQEMWANQDDNGTARLRPGAPRRRRNRLPLPQVDLTQFSSTVVTGNIGSATAGVGVEVHAAPRRRDAVADQCHDDRRQRRQLERDAAASASAMTATRSTSTYSGTGAPTPSDQVILTGNGGNPFSESGWTGWFDARQRRRSDDRRRSHRRSR